MCNTASSAAAAFTRSVILLFAVAIGAFMATAASAQSTTGAILGTVSDADGLAIPGATVTATNVETAQSRTVVTDAEGTYIISALPPGLYQVEVTLSGFAPFKQEQFRVTTAQNMRVDARLAVASVTEQVQVVANTVRVDTRSSSVATNIDPQRMAELPLINRTMLSLVAIAPGIVEVTVPEAIVNNDQSGSVVSGATGGRTNQNDIQLDGAQMTTALYNRPSNLPSPDAIQEFQVLTNSYSAEYGHGGGTTMIAITKSGTNTFRGGVWEYHRNDALNGKNYFAVQKPYMRRNQYGANLGGPIRRSRTFFFFNWEGLRLDQETLLRFNPPTAAQRAGDLSLRSDGRPQTAIIYDPVTRQPFPGNRIPVDRIHPIALRILSYVPVPNQPGGVYQTNIKRDTIGDQFSVKADHKWSDANSFNVRFHRDYPTAPDTSSDIERFFTRIGNKTHAWSANDTHVFSGTMVGEGRASFTDIATTAPLTAEAAIHPRELGFTNVDVTEPSYPIRVPVIQVQGNAGAFNFNPTQSPRVRASKVFSGNYKVSWLAGRHNVKAGGEYVWKWQKTFRHHNSSSGQFVFDGTGTRGADGSGGLGMADFLLGKPVTYSQATLFDKTDWAWNTSYFVQDDIRINRVTLNLGLRLDYQTPFIETGLRTGVYIPGQKSTRYPQAPVGLVYPGDEGVRDGIIRNSLTLNPRLGFAYDVRGDGRTAIRAGYGKFVATIEGIGTSNMEEVPPFHPNVILRDPYSFADPWGPARTPAIFPYQRNDRGEGPFPSVGFTLEPTDPNWKPGNLHQFNVTFQQQVGSDIVVSAGYVGSRGRDLSTEIVLNMAEFIPGASTAQNVEQRRSTYAIGIGAIAQLQRGSFSDYDSLQVTAVKQYSNNYTVQLTYTLGRTKDDGNVGEHVTQLMDPRHPELDHALSSVDRTHVLRLNGMYEFPGLLDKPPVVRMVVGGWRLAGIMSYLSGNMVNVTLGVDRALAGCYQCAPQRPDLNGDPTLPSDRPRDEKIAQWFNTNTTTLWTLPALGQFGNAPRNPIRGPSFFSTDLSLTKIFRLSNVNKQRIEVRIEAFNVFDKVNLDNPTGDRNNVNFGRITSAKDPRIVQLALRFDF